VFGVNGPKVCILNRETQICFCRILIKHQSHAKNPLGVLSKLMSQPLEWELMGRELKCFFIMANLTEGD
jgi:hypothetical protein